METTSQPQKEINYQQDYCKLSGSSYRGLEHNMFITLAKRNSAESYACR